MKNRDGLETNDNWKTPAYIYDPLNEVFKFDHDPCPLNYTVDGLDYNIPWGECFFINFGECGKLSVLNAVSKSQQSSFVAEQIDQKDILPNANHVYLPEVIKKRQKKELLNACKQKDTGYYSMDLLDVQSVNLYNHLIELILLFTQVVKPGLIPIAGSVKDVMQEFKWQKNEIALLREIQFFLLRVDIENLLKGGRDTEKETLSVITSVGEIFATGSQNNGRNVKYTLEISAPIVDQKNFLRKIILFLYHILSVREQSPLISFRLASSVTLPKTINIQMNGVVKNQYQSLIDILNYSIKVYRINNSVFVNPPYSKELKPSFIGRAHKEWRLQGRVCVLLIPAATGTKQFHELLLPYAKVWSFDDWIKNYKYNSYTEKHILFVKGRISFEGVNTKGEYTTTGKGKHDSMIVILK